MMDFVKTQKEGGKLMDDIRIQMVEMEDPTFPDASEHTARITFTNPKGQQISYDANVFLGATF